MHIQALLHRLHALLIGQDAGLRAQRCIQPMPILLCCYIYLRFRAFLILMSVGFIVFGAVSMAFCLRACCQGL